LSTRVSARCCESLLEEGALPVIFHLIKSCNRSTPHIELIRIAVSVLLNVAANPSTAEALYPEEYVDTVAELMGMFKEKDEIFVKTVKILLCQCRDVPRRRELLQTPNLLKRLDAIYTAMDRKAKAELQYIEKINYNLPADKKKPLPAPGAYRHLRTLIALIANAQ
jgi:abnormal spindle-like microcephaly-associated protein